MIAQTGVSAGGTQPPTRLAWLLSGPGLLLFFVMLNPAAGDDIGVVVQCLR